MNEVAEGIRRVTAAMQRAIDEGERSRQIDADDLIEVLLSIADDLDPLLPAENPGCEFCQDTFNRGDEPIRCPYCGTRWNDNQS